VTVRQPNLVVNKTADAATVSSGDPIGFAMTVTNTGGGTALHATLSDALPAATRVDWTISPAYAGPGTCTIDGTPPTETLMCTFASLAPSASVTIQLTSATTNLSCATLVNSVTVQANNNAPVTSTAASIKVDCKPKLAVTKAACPAPSVVPGGFLTYTV